MASTAYTNGLEGLMDNAFDYTSTIKSMLVKTSYTEDPDQAFVDDGSADDLASHEADATGYTGGFNGADRLTTALTTTEQTASNRVVVIPADKTWTAIGGASNNTLEGVALIFEVTNDAASYPIVYCVFSASLTTNGSDILVDFDGTNGNLRFTV